MRYFLLISKLEIHNANAMSSPITIGFPAMTSWLGAMHLLQRRLQEQDDFKSINFSKLGISCHDFNLQTYEDDFNQLLTITANPVDKKGDRPSIIPEARCDLTVSLIFELQGYRRSIKDKLEEETFKLLNIIKVAGGDVMQVKSCELIHFDEFGDMGEQLKPILNKLMLGSVLIERRDLMLEGLNNDNDGLDTILYCLKFSGEKEEKEEKEEKKKMKWSKKQHGWIVPISVGFQGISPLSRQKKILNARDENTPHIFAESVVTLGEFVMPFRIQSIDQFLWRYEYKSSENLYLCTKVL